VLARRAAAVAIAVALACSIIPSASPRPAALGGAINTAAAQPPQTITLFDTVTVTPPPGWTVESAPGSVTMSTDNLRIIVSGQPGDGAAFDGAELLAAVFGQAAVDLKAAYSDLTTSGAQTRSIANAPQSRSGIGNGLMAFTGKANDTAPPFVGRVGFVDAFVGSDGRILTFTYASALVNITDEAFNAYNQMRAGALKGF
jgi:hypothetical protein